MNEKTIFSSFKKLASILLTAALTMSLCTPVFATTGAQEESFTDVINNASGKIVINQETSASLTDIAELHYPLEVDGVNFTLNLNGKTLKVTGDNKFYNDANVIIENGTIDISGAVASGDAIFGIGGNSNASVTLKNVHVIGDGYSSAFAVFYVYNTSVLNIEGGSVVVSNEAHSAGGVFKAQNGANGIINITGTETDPVELTFNNAKIGFLDGTVTFDHVDLDITGGANAINQTALTVKNSSLTIKDCDGRALTANDGDITIINSDLDFSGATEGEIRFKSNVSLTIDKDSTLAQCTVYTDDTIAANINDKTVAGKANDKQTVSVSNGTTTLSFPPKGTVTPAYTNENSFWGEGTSNSSESFVVELYEGNTKIASSSLKNYKGIIDGDVYVTWSIPFEPTNDGDYWVTEWAEGYPKYDMNPSKVVLVADGTKVAENNVQFNGPDNLNKIVAFAQGNTGGLKAYKTLAEAMGKFNGRKVNVVRDVEENISGFYGVTLTTNLEHGATITNTNTTDWIDFDDVTVGSNVTVNIANVYSGDSENVITGTLNVNETYYHGYDAKTTIKDGGHVTVKDSVILRYNEEADSGIYIYGDGDESTVEFDCDYYIGAYSGTFYAEDATIETGYFLLKNSYDDNSFADINMTLDNSSLTVVGTTDGQDSFIIDDQSALTLKNGASIQDVRDFNILANTDVKLSIDSNSIVEAESVFVAEDVPYLPTKNSDGTVTFERKLSGEGSETNPYLINNLEDLLAFQKNVDKQLSDGTSQYAGKYFKLTSDIDLTGINWNPIGSMSGDHGSFKGVFDGNGHTISNLNCQTSGNGLGLFARTAGNAEIKNLTLHNVTVKSTDNSNYVGAVVANSYANTKISNVHVTGNIDISGRGYIGGISGHGYVVMDNVSVKGEGTIDSSFWCAGGILGYGGEGATNITNAAVEGTGETGLIIRSAAGGLGSIVGMAEDNGGTQPISGSNLSAKNVLLQTYSGAYGTSYAEYALGYLYGGNPTSKLTGDLIAENVRFETSTGKKNPPVSDAVALTENRIFFSLTDALNAAQDGNTVTLAQDVDYSGTASLEINKAITLDLNGKTLTTHGTYGGLRLKGGVSLVNGTLNHEGTVTAIKAWNVDKLENLTINVTPKEGKTIGGIVLQEGSESRINSIKNVTINGATNGIETYNCGNAAQDVIGSMENVAIDAIKTGLLLSAPVGTATNCTIHGEETGIVMHRKGNYSVTLDLVNSTVSGKMPIYIYDENYFNASKVNAGEISLTMDKNTQLAGADDNQLVSVLVGEDSHNGNVNVSTEKAYFPDLFHAYLNAANECITVDMGNLGYEESVELKLYTKDGELLTTSVLDTEEFTPGLYTELTGKIVMYGRSGKSWNQAEWTAWDNKPGYEVALVIDGTEIERVKVTDKQNGTEISEQQWIDFPKTTASEGDLYYAYLNAANECITVDMGNVAFSKSVELKLYTKNGELLTTSVLDTNEMKAGLYTELTGKIVMYGRSGKSWNQAEWTAWDDKPGYEVALVIDGTEIERVKVTDKQNGTEITHKQWIDFPKTLERPLVPTVTPVPSVPNTSDDTNLLMHSAVAFSALLAAIVLTLMKKRQLSK